MTCLKQQKSLIRMRVCDQWHSVAATRSVQLPTIHPPHHKLQSVIEGTEDWLGGELSGDFWGVTELLIVYSVCSHSMSGTLLCIFVMVYFSKKVKTRVTVSGYGCMNTLGLKSKIKSPPPLSLSRWRTNRLCSTDLVTVTMHGFSLAFDDL